MSTSKQLDFLIETVYNNPLHSDVVLELNDTKYYLILTVIKRAAPLLFEEFETIPNPTLPIPPSSDLPIDQLLANLVTSLSKPKKTLKMTVTGVTQGVADMLLKSMYGRYLSIHSSNALEVHQLSTRFGMNDITPECINVVKESIKIPTLLEDYQKALSENSPFKQIYFDAMVDNLGLFPMAKVLEFINKMTFEVITQFVSNPKLNCTEDLVYEMIDSWIHTNGANTEQYQSLVSKIKLELLSFELLTSKVKLSPVIDQAVYVKVLETKIFNHKVLKYLRNGDVEQGFAIGRIDQTYDGYRLLTSQDICTNSFRKLFNDHYISKNGILCLDSFEANNLCIAKRRLTMYSNFNRMNWYVRIDVKDVKKDTYVKFCTGHHTDQQMILNDLHLITHSDDINRTEKDSHGIPMLDNTGLFATHSMRFLSFI
jgi:hypothetical protein